MLCHRDESSALLDFKNSLSSHSSWWSQWENGTDCCKWGGITCDPTSGHVIYLYLSDSGLVGTLNSNSSLFHLRHLRNLDLSNNNFNHSPISPMFFSSFPYLEYLDLHDSNFSGELPPEISQLSKILGLQLPQYNGLVKMKMSTFNNIIMNLTHLKELSLYGVNIDSTFPPSITNLSSLISLELGDCNLRGELPANVLNLPLLEEIILEGNHGLHANFPLYNWSTSLQFIDLSFVNFSSKLPASHILSQRNLLQTLYLCGCSFHGQIPNWVWNMSISNISRKSWGIPMPA